MALTIARLSEISIAGFMHLPPPECQQSAHLLRWRRRHAFDGVSRAGRHCCWHLLTSPRLAAEWRATETHASLP